MYRFLVNYRSHIGTWKAGDLAELDAETVAWLQRDVPGCLEAATPPEAEPETRTADAPPQDRMIHKPTGKRVR